mmetsp:Transcript_34647/g.114789  ORF Transcript_34647/g.114789 Transcript_34647/m.114789 type:complete len:93 (+) Transcript_34647:1-279(+)
MGGMGGMPPPGMCGQMGQMGGGCAPNPLMHGMPGAMSMGSGGLGVGVGGGAAAAAPANSMLQPSKSAPGSKKDIMSMYNNQPQRMAPPNLPF